MKIYRGTHNNVEAGKTEPFSIRKPSLNILMVSKDAIVLLHFKIIQIE